MELSRLGYQTKSHVISFFLLIFVLGDSLAYLWPVLYVIGEAMVAR